MKASTPKTRFFIVIKNFLKAWVQRWTKLGLRTKMTIQVMVGLIGLILIFAMLGIISVRQLTQRVLNERVLLARLGATTLDAVLYHIESSLTNLAQSDDLNCISPDSMSVVAAGELSIYGQGVWVVDCEAVQAKQVLISPSSRLSADPLSIEHWLELAAVKQALAGQSFAISVIPTEWIKPTPEQPDGQQKLYAAAATPLRDASGQISGALVALIDLTDPRISPLQGAMEFGQATPLTPGVTLDVVDSGGLVLMSTNPRYFLQNQAEKSPEWRTALQRLFAADAPQAGTCLGCTSGFGLEGQAGMDASGCNAPLSDEVIAFAPLSQAPWGVVVRQPTNEAFAPVRTLILENLLLGCVAMIGALILVWVTTSSVIQPVQRLTQAAQRISQGDLETPVVASSLAPGAPAANGGQSKNGALPIGNEIDDLGRSFEDMRLKLREALNERQALNRELDERVRERTQEAVQAQQTAQAARDRLQKIVAMLEQRNQHLAILNAVANALNRSLELDVILDHALTEILRLTSIDAGAIFCDRSVTGGKQFVFFNETEDGSLEQIDLFPAAAISESDDCHESQTTMQLIACRGISQEAARLAAQLGMLDSSCGGVAERGEMVVVPDLERYRGIRARSLRNQNLNTLVHVPIAARGAVIGSMCVATRSRREYAPQEQELLSAIANQIGVAIDNARLYAEVQRKEKVRGELFHEAIKAQEEERKRIARELHDDTSQNLTALIYAAEECNLLLSELSQGSSTVITQSAPGNHSGMLFEKVAQRMESIHTLAQHTLDGVHKLIFDLRPSLLDHLGLVPALRWFAQSRLEPKGMIVHIQMVQSVDNAQAPLPCIPGALSRANEEEADTDADNSSQVSRLPPEIETAVFRVVQEAISNIARHSGARNVWLDFNFEQSPVTIRIRDDGIGFDLEDVAVSPDSWRGLGLMGMQERLELLGGDLEIQSVRGLGTCVLIRVPVFEVKYVA